MKALIADNKVIEIAETEFEVNSNWQWVDCDNSITTRHTYEDGTFTAPTTVEKTYAQKRIEEYPFIGDQLDDLFHAGAFSDEMTATLQAVKDKYPKE